ncbi:hypothetical protein RLIN73S_05838 [Rhodanobacter lindaniclasticus]
MILGLALGGVLLLCTLPAMAQQSDSWLTRPTLTGDWGGTRTRLQDDGITLRAHWTTESAGNVSGGHYQTARYTQQLDVGADFDLDKLWGVPNAKIQFTVTERDGRSLTNDALGNMFSVQELYGAGQNFRLAELYCLKRGFPRSQGRHPARLGTTGQRPRAAGGILQFPERRDLRPCQRDDHQQRRAQLPHGAVGWPREVARRTEVLRRRRCLPGQPRRRQQGPGLEPQLQAPRRVRAGGTGLEPRRQPAAR